MTDEPTHRPRRFSWLGAIIAAVIGPGSAIATLELSGDLRNPAARPAPAAQPAPPAQLAPIDAGVLVNGERLETADDVLQAVETAFDTESPEAIAAVAKMIAEGRPGALEALTSLGSKPSEQRIYAYAIAKVRERLLAPTTATFPPWGSPGVSLRWPLGGDVHWILEGYVDSQNRFGAMLRKRFNVTGLCMGRDIRGGTVEFEDD